MTIEIILSKFGWLINLVIIAVLAIYGWKFKIGSNEREIERVTKKMENLEKSIDTKLYNQDGSTIYLPRTEFKDLCKNQRENCQRLVCLKLDQVYNSLEIQAKATEAQSASIKTLASSIDKVVGRLDQFIADQKRG